MNSKNNRFKELKGNNIILRKIRLSDASNQYVKWLNSRNVNKFLESRFTKYTKPMLEKFLKKMIRDPNVYFLAIIENKSQKHIGNIKLGFIDKIHKHGSIGIMIGDENLWGRNYGSEAIKLITDFGFNVLHLHKIDAGIYDSNAASMNAFLKAGFFIDGVRYKHSLNNGKFENLIYVGILNREKLNKHNTKW